MSKNFALLAVAGAAALYILQLRKTAADKADSNSLSLAVKNGIASMGAAPWARNALGWPVDTQNVTQAVWSNGQQTADPFSGMIAMGSGYSNVFTTF